MFSLERVPWQIWMFFVVVIVTLAVLLYRVTHVNNRGPRTVPRKASNVTFPYGVAEAMGRRPYMEDRHVVAGTLNRDPTISFYAVFDGHGGCNAADHCVDTMVQNLVASNHFPHRPPQALTEAFESTDAQFVARARSTRPPLDDGCTAVAGLVVGDKLYIANAGDSRAVLVQRSGHVEPLSEDHKPNRPDETMRIRNAGGIIVFHGVWRVGGILAVSRAIGDRVLKPYVTAQPDIRTWTITPADRFLILATDGLWDVFTNRDVAEICSRITDPERIAMILVSEALERGSADNVTALVVNLAHPNAASAPTMAVAGGGGGGDGQAEPSLVHVPSTTPTGVATAGSQPPSHTGASVTCEGAASTPSRLGGVAAGRAVGKGVTPASATGVRGRRGSGGPTSMAGAPAGGGALFGSVGRGVMEGGGSGLRSSLFTSGKARGAAGGGGNAPGTAAIAPMLSPSLVADDGLSPWAGIAQALGEGRPAPIPITPTAERPAAREPLAGASSDEEEGEGDDTACALPLVATARYHPSALSVIAGTDSPHVRMLQRGRSGVGDADGSGGDVDGPPSALVGGEADGVARPPPPVSPPRCGRGGSGGEQDGREGVTCGGGRQDTHASGPTALTSLRDGESPMSGDSSTSAS